jgi:hypothetical protein
MQAKKTASFDALDTRMPYAYEFVKSVESVAAFEGAKQLAPLYDK